MPVVEIRREEAKRQRHEEKMKEKRRGEGGGMCAMTMQYSWERERHFDGGGGRH
jgi:hypothetical protein